MLITAIIDNVYAGTALSATIKITAVVREHSTIELLDQTSELVITSTDIDRGYIDVPSASRIRVNTNNRAGCLLAFETIEDPSRLFNSIYVLLDGREVLLSSGSGWIQLPYIKGGWIREVGYRFTLAKEAQPGIYQWPLAISVLPLHE